jgi:hypothetical protein
MNQYSIHLLLNAFTQLIDFFWDFGVVSVEKVVDVSYDVSVRFNPAKGIILFSLS